MKRAQHFLRGATCWALLAIGGLPDVSRAADAGSVFSAASGSVVGIAGGLEPDRDGTGSRLVVTTTSLTDLEMSTDGVAWQPAAAHEVIWDEGGIVDAASWEISAFDPAATVDLSVRAAPAGSPRSSRFVNVSGRAGFRNVGGSVITGFVFAGADRRFLIRAAGPALVPFGIGQAMANPIVKLYDSAQQPVFIADDWEGNGMGGAIAQAANDLGAFPFDPGSKDAAMLVDLPADAYTVVVASGAGDEGVTLAEVYEVPATGGAGGATSGGLTNLSLRARVEGGERVAIPGFVTEGDSNRRYLIRVLGPGLLPFGVTGALADPRFTVFIGSKAVAANDNWGDSLAADLIESSAATVGALALERTGHDSAVVMGLPPGPFTVVVEDASGAGAQGEVLVEVYVVPAS